MTPRGGLGRYRMGRRVAVPPGRYALDVISRRGGPGGEGRVPQWLANLPVVTVLFGGLGILVTLVATIAQLVAKARRMVDGTPVAEVDWGTLPPVLAGMAGAAVVLAAGLRIGRHVERRLAAAEGDDAMPDLVLRLRRVGEATADGRNGVRQATAINSG